MTDTCCQRHGYDNTGRYHVPGPDQCPDAVPAAETVPPQGRYFASGAYRDTADGKLDYAGFLSPVVLKAYAEYMDRHRVQSDGSLRGSDNWKQGIPRDVYFKSLLRHVHDLWMEHDGFESRDGLDEALGGLLFNVMGYWHERLRGT